MFVNKGNSSSLTLGASRKKDESDVMWYLKNPAPFDRETLGRIVLRRDKDRDAWLPSLVGPYDTTQRSFARGPSSPLLPSLLPAPSATVSMASSATASARPLPAPLYPV
jgi:hypothetical protein